MNLKGELKFENLVALQRDSMKTIGKSRKRITTIKVVAVLLLIFTMFFINPPSQPFAIGFNTVATIIFILIIPIILNKAAERIVRKSGNTKLLGPFSLHLSEEGVEIQRENDRKQVSWKEINQVTWDNENFFLYYGNQSAFVIPKSSVPSRARLMEFLSAYVGEDKIKNRRKAGLNEKQRRVVLSSLVVVLVLLFGMNYYFIKPEHDVSRATRAVSDLFLYTNPEDNGENKLKETTTQAQIDRVIKKLEKIDISKSRYKKYDLLMFGLYVQVNEAQKQLDAREGTQHYDRTNTAKIEYTTNSDLTPMENLLENIPELQDSFNEIPWDMQEKILLPSFDNIPFDVEEVSISYSNRPSVDVYYVGEGMSFTSSVWPYEEGLSQRDEEVQLENSTVGELSDAEFPEDSISVYWSDREKGSKLLYAARLVSGRDGAKDDAIKLANAMIANEEHTYVNQEEGYIPNETDVVLKNDNLLVNKDILEDFITVAGKNNESHMRIVKHVLGRGAILYDLESRYDKNANQGWIEVTPNLTHYKPLEDDFYDLFIQAPQQCGDLSKDVEEGFYKLYECRTNWEYRLLPIVSDLDT